MSTLWIFVIPAIAALLIQCILCFQVKHKLFRHSTLLPAAIVFVLAIYVLNLDPGMFIGLNEGLAILTAMIGVCILAGYGAAWIVYLVIKKWKAKRRANQPAKR